MLLFAAILQKEIIRHMSKKRNGLESGLTLPITIFFIKTETIQKHTHLSTIFVFILVFHHKTKF